MVLGRTLRWIRGVVGTGLTWAAAWGALGALYGVVLGIRNPRYWELANPIVDTGLGLAIAGFVAGSGFGALLGVLDRRRTLETLSRWRVAGWGAAGGALVPVLVHVTRGLTSSAGWLDVAAIAAVTGTFGCLSALGSMKLALSAPGTPTMLEGGDFDGLNRVQEPEEGSGSHGGPLLPGGRDA